jgi:hypothetical protein
LLLSFFGVAATRTLVNLGEVQPLSVANVSKIAKQVTDLIFEKLFLRTSFKSHTLYGTIRPSRAIIVSRVHYILHRQPKDS